MGEGEKLERVEEFKVDEEIATGKWKKSLKKGTPFISYLFT